jgi:hypothetical protein
MLGCERDELVGRRSTDLGLPHPATSETGGDGRPWHHGAVRVATNDARVGSFVAVLDQDSPVPGFHTARLQMMALNEAPANGVADR